MQILCIVLIILYCGNLFATYPRFFNSEYKYWNRGEAIKITGGGTATADQSRNGPCIGGEEIVSKVTLDKSTRKQLAKSPYIKIPPRYAKKVTWLKAPIAGEGRIGGSINYCSGGTEDWIEPVSLAAGNEVTHLACVWVSSGTLGFYLYGSQWTGLDGFTGTSGSYFQGTKAGIDNSNFKQEILHRSNKQLATTKPQCFIATFKLDTLSKAKVTLHNSYIIGVGFDYFDLKVGKDLYLTAMDFQRGTKIPKWEPIQEDNSNKSSYKTLQIVKQIKGISTNNHTIKVRIPFEKGFRTLTPLKFVTNQSPPHQASIKFINKNPIFAINGSNVSETNLSITTIDTDNLGVTLEITGFKSLLPNTVVTYTSQHGLLQLEDW